MKFSPLRFLTHLCLALVLTQAAFADSTFHALTIAMSSSDLPRYTKLPLFAPHRKDFTCVYQDSHLPPVDPLANLWFQQALALELDPNTYWKDKDWRKIYQLYQQAAERNHWNATAFAASISVCTSPFHFGNGAGGSGSTLSKLGSLRVPSYHSKIRLILL